MYQYQLDEMANVIARKIAVVYDVFAGDEIEENVLDLKKHIQAALEEYWAGKIALVWCIEDVLDKADELGIALSNEEAENILDDIFDHHDCEMGVSWVTLGCAIEDYPRNGE
jgi:hypothetical protein